MSITIGQRVGSYDVVSLLGRGGQGEVYRAHDPRIGPDVAIKVLPPEFSKEEELKRFQQEARSTGTLNHPNILAVYDVGTHEGSSSSTPIILSFRKTLQTAYHCSAELLETTELPC